MKNILLLCFLALCFSQFAYASGQVEKVSAADSWDSIRNNWRHITREPRIEYITPSHDLLISVFDLCISADGENLNTARPFYGSYLSTPRTYITKTPYYGADDKGNKVIKGYNEKSEQYPLDFLVPVLEVQVDYVHHENLDPIYLFSKPYTIPVCAK